MSFRRADAIAMLVAFGATAAVFPTPARAEALGADAIFNRAKNAWREREEAPFVSYALRERYTWRDRVHDNWWQASYRDSDRGLALQRQIVPAQEEARMKGVPIHLNVRFHGGLGRADSLDTNSDADAFPVLVPLVEPNSSFGLLAHEARAQLSLASRTEPSTLAAATPALTATPEAVVADPNGLRELGRVEARARDYAIVLVGLETIGSVTAYHLTLTPLRDPNVYRLRELWIDAQSFRTVRLAMHGLFEGKPYDSALWLVSYVEIEGRNYVQQIHTDETLRFGLDRFVSGLQYDFVQYAFPGLIPDMTFRRFL